MQNQDLDALKRLTAGDYVISGGPTGRTASQDQFLEEARTFFAGTAQIDSWSLSAVTVRDLAAVTVCAYDWAERGQHAGSRSSLPARPLMF
jgi:hypothetical protein